jgi:hypothetical protein
LVPTIVCPAELVQKVVQACAADVIRKMQVKKKSVYLLIMVWMKTI